MINFFRNIRRKFADDNQFFKYSRYAIGEIVLVVIGILIALSINNWNEEHKSRLTEIKTLKEIKSNLSIDLVEIQSDIGVMDSVNIAGKAAIGYLGKNSLPSESFKYHIHVSRLAPHFDPNRSGYSLLLSKGLEIVSNDSLRGSISRLYELSYPYYSKYEKERVAMITTVVMPKLVEYFSFHWKKDNYYNGSSMITQSNYSKLQEDSSFINNLNLAIFNNQMVHNRAQRIAGNIKDLIAEIEKELSLKKQL